MQCNMMQDVWRKKAEMSAEHMYQKKENIYQCRSELNQSCS